MQATQHPDLPALNLLDPIHQADPPPSLLDPLAPKQCVRDQQHPAYAPHSLLDLNRAGSPLIEMVTEADITGAEQARAFLVAVQAIAQSLGVSDATPEEGKMRCDVNLSLHKPGDPWGTKVEVKNLNSFRSVERAIAYETARQTRVLDLSFANR